MKTTIIEVLGLLVLVAAIILSPATALAIVGVGLVGYGYQRERKGS